MLKKLVIVFLVLLTAACGFGIYDYIYYRMQISSMVFDVKKYEHGFISDFPTNSDFPDTDIFDLTSFNIGTIDNADTAKEKAEDFWISAYGEKEIKAQKPYYCFYDEKAGVWHITTKKAFKHVWEKHKKGSGAAHLIVQEDGNVLACWHRS